MENTDGGETNEEGGLRKLEDSRYINETMGNFFSKIGNHVTGWRSIKDIPKIPCFRTGFLYGTGGGLAAMLTTFLCTSKGMMSAHTGMFVFVVTTSSTFLYCRYNRAKQLLQTQKLQALHGYDIKDI